MAEEFEEAVGQPKRTARLDALYVLVGFAALLIGANLLVSGATAVAERFGISQAVIGLTVIAVGTSLPELATSVVATLRNKADARIRQCRRL